MNPIENQRQLIDQLYHLVKKSLNIRDIVQS